MKKTIRRAVLAYSGGLDEAPERVVTERGTT